MPSFVCYLEVFFTILGDVESTNPCFVCPDRGVSPPWTLPLSGTSPIQGTLHLRWSPCTNCWRLYQFFVALSSCIAKCLCLLVPPRSPSHCIFCIFFSLGVFSSLSSMQIANGRFECSPYVQHLCSFVNEYLLQLLPSTNFGWSPLHRDGTMGGCGGAADQFSLSFSSWML